MKHNIPVLVVQEVTEEVVVASVGAAEAAVAAAAVAAVVGVVVDFQMGATFMKNNKHKNMPIFLALLKQISVT